MVPKFLILLLIAVAHAQIQATNKNNVEQYPILKIKTGSIRGVKELSRDGRSYYKFAGIPYGKSKRFESSVPPKPWSPLVLDTTTPGPICYQKSFHTQEIIGKEDCLDVNVYTPKLPVASDSGSKLPVLFFVHGGGLWSGSGFMYDPSYFMDEDVVIVSANYRLGPFGFLNLGIKEAPGNQGLKDIILALRWVRDNIQEFNGDPNRVTIFGESAGGAIVSTLIYSPMPRGLFTGVIVQSGPSISEFFMNKRPKHWANMLAKKVGCGEDGSSSSPQQIIQCLKDKDKEAVLDALNPLLSDWENEDECSETQYNFSVEDKIEGAESALPEHPLTLIAKGDYPKVPVMIGVNKYETWDWGKFWLADENRLRLLNEEWNRVAPMPFMYYNAYGHTNSTDDSSNTQSLEAAKRDKLSQKIRQFYFKNAPIKNDRASIKAFEKIMSDRMENSPTRSLAKLLAEQGLPTYLYMFDKKMNSVHLEGSGRDVSPQHAEELNYLFNVPPPDGVSPPIGTDSPDYEFSKNMVKLWVSFAVDGKPTVAWGKDSPAWRPLGTNPKEEPEWYHLDEEGKGGLGPQKEDDGFQSRMKFWEQIDQELTTTTAAPNKQTKPVPSLPTIKIEGLSIKKKEKEEL